MNDLLEAARNEGVSALLRAIDENCIPEPALRMADGSIAFDSEGLRVPLRKDMATREQGNWITADVNALTVKPASSLRTIWNDQLRIEIKSITWDYTTFRLRPCEALDDCSWLRGWFLRWFDLEDTNKTDQEGLSGVVHFISDPERMDTHVQVTIDFGSAPIQAFHELLDCFIASGITDCEIG